MRESTLFILRMGEGLERSITKARYQKTINKNIIEVLATEIESLQRIGPSRGLWRSTMIELSVMIELVHICAVQYENY